MSIVIGVPCRGGISPPGLLLDRAPGNLHNSWPVSAGLEFSSNGISDPPQFLAEQAFEPKDFEIDIISQVPQEGSGFSSATRTFNTRYWGSEGVYKEGTGFTTDVNSNLRRGLRIEGDYNLPDTELFYWSETIYQHPDLVSYPGHEVRDFIWHDLKFKHPHWFFNNGYWYLDIDVISVFDRYVVDLLGDPTPFQVAFVSWQTHVRAHTNSNIPTHFSLPVSPRISSNPPAPHYLSNNGGTISGWGTNPDIVFLGQDLGGYWYEDLFPDPPYSHGLTGFTPSDVTLEIAITVDHYCGTDPW